MYLIVTKEMACIGDILGRGLTDTPVKGIGVYLYCFVHGAGCERNIMYTGKEFSRSMNGVRDYR